MASTPASVVGAARFTPSLQGTASPRELVLWTPHQLRTWLPLRVGVGHVEGPSSVAGACRTTESCPATSVAMPTTNVVEGGLKTQAPIRCMRLAYGLRDLLRVERKYAFSPLWSKECLGALKPGRIAACSGACAMLLLGSSKSVFWELAA